MPRSVLSTVVSLRVHNCRLLASCYPGPEPYCTVAAFSVAQLLTSLCSTYVGARCIRVCLVQSRCRESSNFC